VIEHVEDDRYFISQAKRILKNGGLFVLATPNKVMRLSPGMAPWNIYHLREYTAEELKDLLSGVYGQCEIFGLTAQDDVLNKEKKRIKDNQRLAGYDIFNLRRHLPVWLTAKLIKIAREFKSSDAKNKEFKLQGATRDLYRIEERVSRESLDLLAVSRK
jgi:SAM-dependent methyltransferase